MKISGSVADGYCLGTATFIQGFSSGVRVEQGGVGWGGVGEKEGRGQVVEWWWLTSTMMIVGLDM